MNSCYGKTSAGGESIFIDTQGGVNPSSVDVLLQP